MVSGEFAADSWLREGGRVLGFDYGKKRVGVAIGHSLTGSARPLSIIRVQSAVFPWHEVDALLKEWRPGGLVVGLPRHADGSDCSLTRAVLSFGEVLQQRSGLRVFFVDETLSSVEAQRLLSGRAGSRGAIDAVAAAVILETWLAECGGRG